MEFFQMCLLSFKMNNQSMEAVMELDHKDLFSKCVNRDKKSFYEFNDWIKAEVSRIRFKQVYGVGPSGHYYSKQIITVQH